MIIIYTGIEEIDREIQEEIRDTIIANYSDYLIENDTFKNQTVILSSNAVQGDLHEYLFTLKQMNMRIILLIKSKKDDAVKVALQLGIYDMIFGNFYPSQIRELLDKPKNFTDISDLYKKTFGVKEIKRKGIRNKNSNFFFSRR